MTPELKAQWIAALRSGYYKQGRRALCQKSMFGNRLYCPLGVLYEVATGIKTPYIISMPPKFQASIELDDWYVRVSVILNDTYRQSFSKIADKLEEGDTRLNIV